MSNMIVVDLNGFCVEKNITIFQDNKETITTKAKLSNIANYCANLIVKYGVRSLKVYGPPSFATGIVTDIRDIAKKEYNYNLLEIEVVTK